MLLRLAVAIGFLVSSSASFAAAPMTKLKIDVSTLSDKPIERAAVIVQFVEGRSILKLGKKIQTHWEVRSNQEGIATIPAVPQGKIRVQVTASGFQSFGQIFDVTEEAKTLKIKLNPPQPQYSAH